MTQPWRALTVATLLSATFGVGPAAAQTVMARRVPAGEQVEVMLNGKSVGSAAADAAGDATIPFNMRNALGKTEIDANIYVDRCDTKHRVWIVEVGGALPSEGTCDLRSVSGLYWVRDISTIVVNDVTAAAPTLLLFKGAYTPPAPGQESGPSAPPREFPAGLVLFGGAGLVKTNDATTAQCGDVTSCSGQESGIGFTGGGEYRFNRWLSAEVSYLKPSTVTTSGSDTTFRFTSEQKAHIFTLVGKISVPIGLAKLYGRAGASYNQAKIVTTETLDAHTVTVDDVPVTIPGGTQANELKTDGWGWIYGGGLEVWVARSFAIYGEFDYAALKGADVNDGEARINNRVGAVLAGLRVHIGK